jgi:hypothetical protein
MSKADKTFEQILSARADANIRFDEMRLLLTKLGFRERIRSSHHIFTRPGIEALIDLQPKQGKCKPYQVRQVRDVLTKFNISL